MTKKTPFRADSLATGVSVMLVLTIVQRAIGFGRGVWFCRLMDDASLGQWAMGFGFLMLATPMFLLGLPGALPRFVDGYLNQGQLRPFLLRVLGATGVVVALGLASMLSSPQTLASWVFDQQHEPRLVFALAVAVLGVVIFNVTNEVVAGLRLVRVSSIAQFTQSVAFTVLGILWLMAGGGVAGLLVAFGASSLVGTVPAWWALARGWQAVDEAETPLDASNMWRRLLPYAASIWLMNILSNTFEMTDRYMLLHLLPEGGGAGQRAVGQYHAAMIVPALLISVANMGSSVLLPYLSADWEQGRRLEVAERMRQAIWCVGIVFITGAAVALLGKPLLYGVLLDGQFEAGVAVLPLCLVYCIWCSLVIIAQTFLFVAERGRWVTISLICGLGVNLVLNALLVPRLGLPGAIWGTTLANLVILAGIGWGAHRTCQQEACQLADLSKSPSIRLAADLAKMVLLAASLLAGPSIALGMIVLVAVASPFVRRQLAEVVRVAGCQFRVLAR